MAIEISESKTALNNATVDKDSSVRKSNSDSGITNGVTLSGWPK